MPIRRPHLKPEKAFLISYNNEPGIEDENCETEIVEGTPGFSSATRAVAPKTVQTEATTGHVALAVRSFRSLRLMLLLALPAFCRRDVSVCVI